MQNAGWGGVSHQSHVFLLAELIYNSTLETSYHGSIAVFCRCLQGLVDIVGGVPANCVFTTGNRLGPCQDWI